MRLKVCHLSAGSIGSGAGRGAFWLHQALVNRGIDSRFYCSNKGAVNDDHVYELAAKGIGQIFDIVRRKLETLPFKFDNAQAYSQFSTGYHGKALSQFKEIQDSDVVHLHYISGGFFDIKTLSSIDKPIVWTMRDMWPLTGGCHYSLGCKKFMDVCGACPQLNSGKQKDITWKILRRKKAYLPRNLTLVGISNWLTEQAKLSSIFKDSPITTIPNCINTTDFRPVNKDFARDLFRLPRDKKIVLTGAAYPKINYKGFPEFLAAINSIPTSENLCVVIFGNLQNDTLEEFKHEVRVIGQLDDTASLVALYNAADVFVAPSREEAFGKTLVEAMACSVPVVAFNHAGPADIVTHLETGYLANPFDCSDLDAGIVHVLEQGGQSFADRCRERAERNYSLDVVAAQYDSLYKSLVN